MQTQWWCWRPLGAVSGEEGWGLCNGACRGTLETHAETNSPPVASKRQLRRVHRIVGCEGALRKGGGGCGLVYKGERVGGRVHRGADGLRPKRGRAPPPFKLNIKLLQRGQAVRLLGARVQGGAQEEGVFRRDRL